MNNGANIKNIFVATAAVLALLVVAGSRLLQLTAQTQTANPFLDWRPSNDTQGVNYVGSHACLECHTKESVQLATPMAEALKSPPDCDVLNAHAKLTFKQGPFSYEISRQGKNAIFTVTDGTRVISEPILYCFGQAKVGQTYTFSREGEFYETRVSYFREIDGLDLTIGQRRSVPTSLEEALGRKIGAEETQNCFGCHTTAAVNGEQLQLDHLKPGVTCEACHGPGTKHIAVVKAHNFKDLQIFNPGKLTPNDLTQSFCGSCHISFEQAMLLPGQSGMNNIRFQPYRMFNSPGHNKNDARISCLACHDPHQKLEKNDIAYDAKCLACHLLPKEKSTAARSAPACPVAKEKCVSCHMPKIDLPDMHAKFTDHWIRIVRPNEPVPR